MTSSRRSGLRALFERRHEVTTAMPMPGADVRVAYWHLDDRFHETGVDEASIDGTGSMLVDSSFEKI
jgi:hypothetical protein